MGTGSPPECSLRLLTRSERNNAISADKSGAGTSPDNLRFFDGDDGGGALTSSSVHKSKSSGVRLVSTSGMGRERVRCKLDLSSAFAAMTLWD